MKIINSNISSQVKTILNVHWFRGSGFTGNRADDSWDLGLCWVFFVYEKVLHQSSGGAFNL